MDKEKKELKKLNNMMNLQIDMMLIRNHKINKLKSDLKVAVNYLEKIRRQVETNFINIYNNDCQVNTDFLKQLDEVLDKIKK